MTAATKTPTAAQLKLNHERTEKAVAKLNEKAWNGIRYYAILEEGKTGVIVQEVRPYGQTEFAETVRITTDIDQVIGTPVGYTYKTGNIGSMCYRIDAAATTRRNKLDGLRVMQNKVDRIREELLAAEEAVAKRKAELGL